MNCSVPRSFRVVSWNVHALPRFLSWQQSADDRLRCVRTRLVEESPDLILLQEMWQAPAAERFANALERHGFMTLHPPGRGLGSGAGGLMMFARTSVWRPSEQPWFWQFSNTGSIRGGDRFGNKGAMFARLRHESGLDLAIVNTHLQAQYGFGPGPDVRAKRGYPDVRRAQISELERWVQMLGDVAPVLIAGDFNTFPSEWAEMRPATWVDLTAALRSTCGCNTFLGDGRHEDPSWLDYLFWKAPETFRHEATVSLLESTTIDVPYSDHQGLRADVIVDRYVPDLRLLPLALMAGVRTRREWLAGIAATMVGGLLKGTR